MRKSKPALHTQQITSPARAHYPDSGSPGRIKRPVNCVKLALSEKVVYDGSLELNKPLFVVEGLLCPLAEDCHLVRAGVEVEGVNGSSLSGKKDPRTCILVR